MIVSLVVLKVDSTLALPGVVALRVARAVAPVEEVADVRVLWHDALHDRGDRSKRVVMSTNVHHQVLFESKMARKPAVRLAID